MASETIPGPVGNTVEISLLSYKFRFKRLFWREELGVETGKGKDPVRAVLARALEEVSGLRPASVAEAQGVIDAIPEAIVTRVWRVYKGSWPPARRFSTTGLYRAPKSSVHIIRVQEDEENDQDIHDRSVREMEDRFGKKEVQEEAELSRRVLAAARNRKDGGFVGAVPATPEGEKDGRP